MDRTTRWFIKTMLRPHWSSDDDLAFFIVPTDEHGGLNLERMVSVMAQRTGPITDKDKQTLILDVFGNHFALERLRPDLTPMSAPVPLDGEQKFREEGFASYADYANEILQQTGWTAAIDETTPMIQVLRLPGRRHNLQPGIVLQTSITNDEHVLGRAKEERFVKVGSMCKATNLSLELRSDIMVGTPSPAPRPLLVE
jgi:hypothetical protein